MKIGQIFGFILSYAIFSTLLYFVLKITEKLPKTWQIYHILGITLIVIILGLILKRWLK